jgi:threonine synthase
MTLSSVHLETIAHSNGYFHSQKFKKMPISHLKYAPALPLPKNAKKWISEQEGGTRLVQSLRKKNVFYKLEYENPTGSFKDRGSQVEISHAAANGVKHVVCASTGNMGASISAYGARAGIRVTIVVPRNTPINKLKQIKMYGAQLIQVPGDYSDALRKTWEMAAFDEKIMLCGDYPLRAQGQKTIAYEVVEQLGWKAPENMMVPIGNGTLVYALYMGFREMMELGLIKKMPRLMGVQGRGQSGAALQGLHPGRVGGGEWQHLRAPAAAPDDDALPRASRDSSACCGKG